MSKGPVRLSQREIAQQRILNRIHYISQLRDYELSVWAAAYAAMFLRKKAVQDPDPTRDARVARRAIEEADRAVEALRLVMGHEGGV